MGAPVGNQNAAKGKRWAAAIERALIRRATGKTLEDAGERSELIMGLDLAAEQFVEQLFVNKDLGYFKELGDRTDGKPAQTIAGDPEAPLSIQGLTVSLVPAKG